MRYLCIVLLVFLYKNGDAQIDKILKNKNIVWAAEVTTDLVLDDANLAYDSAVNYLYTLKYTPFRFNQLHNDDREYLQNRYYEMIDSKSPFIHKIHGDPSMYTNPIFLDTIEMVNPTTYKTSTKVVVNDRRENIKKWRLKSIVFYDNSTKKWESENTLLVPLIEYFDYNLEKKVLAEYPTSIKIETKKGRLKSKNITWAKRSATRNKGSNHMQLDSVKILKNTADPMALHLLDFDTNLKNVYYNDGSLIENQKLTPSVRKGILHSIDSIETIDPNTYVTTLKVVQNDITSKEIRKLRLVHDWFWDNKKRQLYVRLAAVAPMKQEETYERPLFYQKY